MRYIRKDGTVVPGAFVGLDGRPVARTPCEYRYSYDEYLLFKDPSYRPTDQGCYSDRLMQWDHGKFRESVARTWPDDPESQCFSGKAPADVEKFLSIYEGRPLKLTALMQGCDHGSGNPYWVFLFRHAGPAGETKSETKGNDAI